MRKDLKDIAQAERLTELPRLVRVLAQYSAQLVNYSGIGAEIGMDNKTTRRYVSLLEQVFLVSVAQPWYTNALRRIMKTPKVHFVDSALLAAAKGITRSRIRNDPQETASILESFVLERSDGTIVGIETKASTTIRSSDLKGLKKLAEAAGDRIACGALLYDGDRVIPRSDNLSIVPISCLWH